MTDPTTMKALAERLRERTKRINGLPLNSDTAEHFREAATALDTAAAEIERLRGGVEVKALEWDDATSALVGSSIYFARSVTPFSSYRTEQIIGKWRITGPHGDCLRKADGDPLFDTLDEAKAAAQADFTARIRSAIKEQDHAE
jgi:hypothetical protein